MADGAVRSGGGREGGGRGPRGHGAGRPAGQGRRPRRPPNPRRPRLSLARRRRPRPSRREDGNASGILAQRPRRAAAGVRPDRRGAHRPARGRLRAEGQARRDRVDLRSPGLGLTAVALVPERRGAHHGRPRHDRGGRLRRVLQVPLPAGGRPDDSHVAALPAGRGRAAGDLLLPDPVPRRSA